MAQIEAERQERSSLTQVVHKIENLLVKYEFETARIEKEFNVLAGQWYMETLHSSAYLDKVLHPAYQRIIGLGQDVIPLILRELQDAPAEWFWALRALTGEDPTTSEQSGKKDEMAKAWLNWGKENGYL
ncbi:MAG: hypothetical protein ACR2MG_17545 [Pyrinomonadaceae bacterium]